MRAVFLIAAAGLALAIASRYPPIAALLPAGLAPVIAGLVGAVLLVVGLFERRAPRGTVGPLWMQLPRPLSACLALGLSFFTTAFAQLLGLSLGPVDPAFPADAPPGIATLWFFMFTLGFTGIGMISAPALMVPLLRALTWPVRSSRLAVALPVAFAVGALFALGLVAVASRADAAELVTRGKAFFDAHEPAGTLLLVAIAVVPNLLPSKKDE